MNQKNWSATPARTENCEADLTRKQKQSASVLVQQTPPLRDTYVVCERASGAVRFRVDADSDGTLPVEKIAGLLAVHCLVRGQAPEDFELMVAAKDSMLPAVAERAQQLIAAGRSLSVGVKVSRREQEVLGGILHGRTNKEIASKLNLSERTVKFHVSSLLAKFGVTGRTALSREVVLSRMPAVTMGTQMPPSFLFGYPVQDQENEREELPERDPFLPVKQSSRTRSQVLPMLKERFAT